MILKKADAHHPDQLLLSSDQLFLPYKNHENFASKVGQKILTNSPDQLLTNFGAKTYDILHEVMIPPKSQKTLETCVFPAFYRVRMLATPPPFRKLSTTVLLHVGSRLSPHTRSKRNHLRASSHWFFFSLVRGS